ncbi:MAG: replication factor C large subunit [Methanolinea sp.]|nr:replication factor C large subunit [Methanolinea sp.]
MDWAEKYRPAHLDEVVGNTTVLHQMLDWARTWTPQKKPLLLYGKPGTGKTTSAHALANDMHWEAIELNASDQRTRAVIERVAGSGSTTASLSGGKRLIIIDEADNLHGTADRGGARAIIELLKVARQPVVLIANDLYGIPGEIRNRCEALQFRAIQARSIIPRLRYICSAEKISCTENALRKIAESANGDLRSAIHMLEAAAAGRDRLDEEIIPSAKDERSSLFDVVGALYGRSSPEAILRTFYDADESPDTIIQWIEANLTGLAEIEDLDRAYSSLSRADTYIGDTYRLQYYTLWRYATAIMVLGVAGVTAGKGLHARIMPPDRWRRISSYQKQKAVRGSFLRKVASCLHMPEHTLLGVYLEPLTLIMERDPLTYARIFNLDTDELAFAIHDREKSAAVMKVIAAEEKEKETKREKERREQEGKRRKREKEDVASPPPGEKPALPDSEGQGAAGEKPGVRNQKTLFDGF